MVYMCSPIFAMCSLAAYWAYFTLRVKFTLDAQVLYNKIFWMAWVFIGVELGVACMLFSSPFISSLHGSSDILKLS